MKSSIKEIHRSYDEYGPIQVLDDGHKRYMTFGSDDEQSCQLIRQPHILQHEYTRAILLSLLMVEPNNITMIGVGGGSLITTLHYLLPQCKIQGIELRREVTRAAYKYFQLPRDNNITLHIKDGFQYMQDTEISSDLIIADMYLADGINQEQLSSQFIETSYKKLNQGGWLVLNYWLDHKLEDYLANTLNTFFDQVYMCDTGGGNWIIFAGKVNINHNLINDKKIKVLSQNCGFSLNYYLKRLVTLA